MLQKLRGNSHLHWPDSELTKVTSNSRFHGWRVGVLFGVVSSATILCFNMAVLAFVASTKHGFEGGFAEPFNLEAHKLSRLSTLIHVLINALSTILLAASNFTMQVISSPTRDDLDKAYKSGEWFDVGVLSIRNLKQIPRRRLAICIVLGLSPIPLHLFYNSAAIYIATTNQYNVHIINQASWNWRNLGFDTAYEDLSRGEWRDQYDTALVHHGDLYIGFNETAKLINGELIVDTNWNPNTAWELGGDRTLIHFLASSNVNSTEWLNFTSKSDTITPAFPDYARVAQVFAHRAPRRDKIVFSLYLLVIVIACNTVKLITLVFVLLMEKSDFAVTLGDCAASFLHSPDPSTTRMCVYSRDSVIATVRSRAKGHNSRLPVEKVATEDPERWRKQRHPYATPVSRSSSIGEYFM
ncbi:hypothetical protein P171DRAFT_365159 [Karstenula rhodostoma CBS 690.94]|uniref:DUF6536 domain-containing protein n=1 Tax=Karstenula rhodostoma CBS 690.94 TaxID=1392251 RepID=A0A9P4U9T5_9PLEO|nr:hypothetical protein P171DRAFT_365159 [Karstenula rhodostoma CBS 690.94]